MVDISAWLLPWLVDVNSVANFSKQKKQAKYPDKELLVLHRDWTDVIWDVGALIRRP